MEKIFTVPEFIQVSLNNKLNIFDLFLLPITD